jgi:molybdopterin-dependent oxidoreductase alpha subunit
MRIVSLSPFGFGYQKPHHYWEMLRVLWENRDNLPYAWRILKHGVCDGCALSTRGLYDDTIEGVHLCLSRLRLLRLNTMPAAPESVFSNVDALRRKSGKELWKLGRLPWPMRRWRGDRGFERISWEEAIGFVAARLRAADPQRTAFYTTSRGLTNETYYVAQKVARLLGTNHIDNAARLCHAASSVALKQTLGVGASTVSYSDWLKTKLLVLMGTNIANNQPVAMKYIYEAKRNGARIAVLNPFREPALERYWIPSIARSALFGTRIMDDYFPVGIGGDAAYLNGVLKWLIEWNAVDQRFIEDHTSGWSEVRAALDGQQWPDLEQAARVSRAEMARFAKVYADAASAILIWSMGLTQHRHGVDTVRTVVNLALARGLLDKPHSGVVPIRGHSGVQGGAECGSVPDQFPGGAPVNEENAKRFSELWGGPVPSWKGMSCGAMLEAAAAGMLDLFYVVGGNFVDTMPDPVTISAAMARVPVRVHQDIVLNSSMLLDSGEACVILPAKTRYEQRGGGTQTSTERRIRYSPHIPGQEIGETRSEWEILAEIGRRAGAPVQFDSADDVRAEMDRVMPLYRGIVQLRAEGQSFQYGGPRLLEGGVCPNLPDGRARFSVVYPPDRKDGLKLATRRGAQFNSLIFKEADAITGGTREDIFLSPADASRLDIRSGDAIVLESDLGSMPGRARIEDVQPGTVHAHWPEANVLLRCRYDPQSGEPDYNAEITVRKVTGQRS